MIYSKVICLCLTLMFTTSLGDGTTAAKDILKEIIDNGHNTIQTQPPTAGKCQENDEKDCENEFAMNANETGPLDSHEAMNTREFKTRTKRGINVDKKSFRNMLLGAIPMKKQTNDIKDVQDEPPKIQSDASELLLELMVRIAAHPQQWNEVHSLLQKIDQDLTTSKKLMTDFQINNNLKTVTVSNKQLDPATTVQTETESNHKLVILLNDSALESFKLKNSTQNWPNLDEITDKVPQKEIPKSGDVIGDDIAPGTDKKFEILPDQKNDDKLSENSDETSQNVEKSYEMKSTTLNIFPWSSKPRNTSQQKEFEFQYHRVTGLPLPYRSNYDKQRARNAYIAVSVIAPKSRDIDKQENVLEDQLHRLKPWSHQENLENMESIRKKWWIQNKDEVTP